MRTKHLSHVAALVASSLLLSTACRTRTSEPETEAHVVLSAAPVAGRTLFMDVHRLGPGNVRLEDVEEAHVKDLAVQGDFDVDYRSYWVDEEGGTIYCLVEAPSAEAAATVHKEAHGLVADDIIEVHDAETAEDVHRRAHGLVADEIVAVRPGILPGTPLGDRRLFMDTHEMGRGLRGEDVADAHRHDLSVQHQHGVNFLSYWYDEATGRIHCLAEAGSREDVVATHEEAHGLVPAELREVVAGE